MSKRLLPSWDSNHLRIDGDVLCIGESGGCRVTALDDDYAVALFLAWLREERARDEAERAQWWHARETEARRAALKVLPGENAEPRRAGRARLRVCA